METSSPVIELCDADIESAGASGKSSVRRVTWRIERGDFWVVGGLASSGKSGLLETAAGLREPASGHLLLFGLPADSLTDRAARGVRRRIGLVYGQGGRLLSHLTIAQNIALPLCYHRNCDGNAVGEEVGAWLAHLGLVTIADRLPGQVSPAFRQRGALARALALEPEVLFLDEPLGQLNTAQIRWWTEFLGGAGRPAGLERFPAALIVATDDLRPWLPVARQYALIQKGEWRVIGGQEELANAREPLLRELLAESMTAG